MVETCDTSVAETFDVALKLHQKLTDELLTDAISKVFHHTGKLLHKEVSIVLHKVLQTGALQLIIMQVIGHHSWFCYAIGKAGYLCHGFQPTQNQIHNNAADAVAINNVY